MMNLVVVFVIVLIPSSCCAITCQHWRLELDALGNTLFLAGDRRFIVPSTVSEVESEYCKKNLQAVDGLHEISRNCLTPFVKQVSGLLTFGFRKSIRRICTDINLKTRLLQKFNCFRNETNKETLDSTMSSLILKLEFMRDHMVSVNSSIMMLQTCCAYENYVKVSMRTLHSL